MADLRRRARRGRAGATRGGARGVRRARGAASGGLGGRLLDPAPMYGASEEVAGDIAARLGVRSRLFVATKVWTTGRARGIEQMEDSMRKLRASTVDLMQVHNLVDVATHL